jgi:diacylglycerol kinase family enzyme
MMRDTPRADKRRFGRVAYAWTGLRKLLGYQPHRLAVTIDGEPRVVRTSEVMMPTAVLWATRRSGGARGWS